MPFKSKAQEKFMFAAQSRGQLPKGTAERWAHETPSMKALPARVGVGGAARAAKRALATGGLKLGGPK